jgi:hypothetical protein
MADLKRKNPHFDWAISRPDLRLVK